MPGVGALLKRIGEQDIQNIRIVAHDAVEVLDNMLTPDSLDGVHIFFPDPWHKKRHHKRRLIQDAFVAKLVGRLKIGGYLHCATDWGPYAEQIRDVLTANPNLVNTSSQTDGDRAAAQRRWISKRLAKQCVDGCRRMAGQSCAGKFGASAVT